MIRNLVHGLVVVEKKLYEVNVPTKNTSTAKTPTRSSIPAVKNVVPTNNTPINLSSDMSYKDADKAFTQKISKHNK